MKKGEEAVKFVKKTPKKKDDETTRLLTENLVSLQKVMTNLVVKFDTLSDNISKLLQLFEISARSFMDKQSVKEVEKDKEFLDKLNALLDQNKTIAKGLTLMEEKFRERVYGRAESPETQRQAMPMSSGMGEIKKLPRFSGI